MTPHYTVRPIDPPAVITAAWNESVWQSIPEGSIDNFRPESSEHRPRTLFKLAYSPQGLHGIFRVDDRYVRCVRQNFQDEVCKDSCVEFFFSPDRKAYFNFEFNCGGTMLAHHRPFPDADGTRSKNWCKLDVADAAAVDIATSLPPVIDPEIAEPVTWTLRFMIPFSVLEKYAGTITPVKKQTWHANFYKCGDDTSHPHWASWSPLNQKNFHVPACFGEIHFA